MTTTVGPTGHRVARRLGAAALIGAVLVGAFTTGRAQEDGGRTGLTGVPAIDALADERARDTGPDPVPLPQVASGAREDVPSALDDPDAEGLPPPSLDLERLVAGDRRPTASRPSTSRASSAPATSGGSTTRSRSSWWRWTTTPAPTPSRC